MKNKSLLRIWRVCLILKAWHALLQFEIEMGVVGPFFELHTPNFQKICIFLKILNLCQYRILLSLMVLILIKNTAEFQSILQQSLSSPNLHATWQQLQYPYCNQESIQDDEYYLMDLFTGVTSPISIIPIHSCRLRSQTYHSMNTQKHICVEAKGKHQRRN